MPLIDSFKVDHTRLKAPCLRIAKTMDTREGSTISVYDLRFVTPNESCLPEKGMHTLEHLIAGFMRARLKRFKQGISFLDDLEIIDISPMGCRTGFYLSMIGRPYTRLIIAVWLEAMKDVLAVESQQQIPELNKYQCGSYKMHSLDEAKEIAQNIIDKGVTLVDNSDILLSDEELAELGN